LVTPASVPTADSNAALAEAASHADAVRVHILLHEGADVNSSDAEGLTPLHRMAAASLLTPAPLLPVVAELLIDAGADVNSKDSFGATPLHYAALGGRTEVVNVLLMSGADPSRKARDGVTPLDVARAENKVQVVRQLTGYFARIQGMDLSYGIVLEGELQVKRQSSLSLFKWKAKHAVISKPLCALLLWTGTNTRIDGAVTLIKLDTNLALLHDAKSNARRFGVKPPSSDALELAAASAEDAALWIAALRATSSLAQEDKATESIAREVLATAELHPRVPMSSEAAAVSTSNPSSAKEVEVQSLPSVPSAAPSSIASIASIASVASTAVMPSTSPAAGTSSKQGVGTTEKSSAAKMLQRAARGFLARKAVRGWVRIVDDDGDIYWYNVTTDTSSWVPPTVSSR
jgi:hypothetical protein